MMDTKKSVTSRPEGFTTPADRRLEKTRVRALATKDHPCHLTGKRRVRAGRVEHQCVLRRLS